ncbi:hypothetical protein PLIP_a3086 [Pseudoalteromonas lipolytica LMEB 39]|nr:hypothetical protein [Pseudoalteromonas lipolytica LMEB 39]
MRILICSVIIQVEHCKQKKRKMRFLYNQYHSRRIKSSEFGLSTG